MRQPSLLSYRLREKETRGILWVALWKVLQASGLEAAGWYSEMAEGGTLCIRVRLSRVDDDFGVCG